MRSLAFALLSLGLGLVPASAANAPLRAVVSDSHPETQLLTALDDLQAGRVHEAWNALDRLVKRQPNFRLAQLFYGELLAARSGAPAKNMLVSSNEPEVKELVEEARLRLRQWHQSPPANAGPDAILRLSPAHPYAVVVDLTRARLYLMENTDQGLRVARHYYAASGKNGTRKQSAGDNRTPIGVYRVTGALRDAELPELYGAGAFPVSYPNEWDQRQKKTGNGIWLHGVPRETYSRAPRSSEGCVTLANADLMELKPYLKPGQTPVIFSDSLNWQPRAKLDQQREEFLKQLEHWRARWSARDTDAYLAHYASDFETDGMNKRSFSEYKQRVNASKSFIEVKLSDVDVFRYPGDEALMLARFTQNYRSDSFSKSTHKEQFWRREADGRWRIVKESAS